MRRPVRWTLWGSAGIVTLLLLLGIAAVLILPSAWFREKVRVRMITEIERASGGRTEVGDFKFDWKALTAEVTPFALHGTEPATEASPVPRQIRESRTENRFNDEARHRYHISCGR